MRRRTARAFFERASDERAHARPVEAREFRGERLECFGFRQQSLAPAFEPALPRRVEVAALRPEIEALANRRRILVAHELADELHLSFASTPGRDPAGGGDSVDQTLRQVDF